MEKIKNSKLLFIILIFVFIILICFVTLFQNTTQKYIEITQLGNISSRQMMGYVIKTNNNNLIVIDGGTKEDTDNLIENILNNGRIVDYWFITHAHDDHAGAFVKIIKETDITVKNVVISLNQYEWYEENEPLRSEFSKELIDLIHNSRIKNVVYEPNVNDKIQIDDIDVEILGIRNPEIIENPGNEQSMVIKFKMGEKSLLILGDTGVKSSEKLINNQKEKLKSNIVQMSHHGQNGATKELYEQIQPEICLWPTPEWLWNNDSGEGYNSGSWKTLETREWIKEIGVLENYIEKDGNQTINIYY